MASLEELRSRAEPVVAGQIERMRQRPYRELVERIEAGEEHVDMPLPGGPHGTERPEVVLETEAMWDSEPGGDIRVMVSIWMPLRSTLAIDDFIMAPDGSFVDEVEDE